MMVANVILAQVQLLSGYCYHDTDPPLGFFGASEIEVWISTNSTLALTRTTAGSDGRYGIDMTASVAERQVKTAINTINGLAVDIPLLVYGGTTSSLPGAPANGILVHSDTLASFEADCTTSAEACFVNPVDPSSTNPAFISFKPRTKTESFNWTSSPDQQGQVNDFGGALVHEILHTLALRHANSHGIGDPGCPLESGDTYWDGTDDPRSVMNTDWILSTDPDSMRWPFRDDIEGLQAMWGIRQGTSGNGFKASNPEGTWTAETGAAPSSTQTRTALAASSFETDSDNEAIAVAYAGNGDILYAARRTGNGSFTQSTFGFGDDDRTWARPAAAYGNDRFMYLWIDETEKEHGVSFPDGLVVRKAIFNGSTWSNGHVRYASDNTQLKIRAPIVNLGFDETSDQWIMTTINSGANAKGQLLVYILNDSGNVLNTDGEAPVFNSHVISSVGKAVCTNTACAIPVVYDADEASPLFRFEVGSVGSDAWQSDHLEPASGGWIAYGGVDHARGAGAQGFAVTWQSLSGSALIHKRDCVSGCNINSTEFSINQKLPVAIGSNAVTSGATTWWFRALTVTSW